MCLQLLDWKSYSFRLQQVTQVAMPVMSVNLPLIKAFFCYGFCIFEYQNLRAIKMKWKTNWDKFCTGAGDFALKGQLYINFTI